MFTDFQLYDLFITAFVQLVFVTCLMFTPWRVFDTRHRWSGYRLVEVVIGAAAGMAVAATAGLLSMTVWGIDSDGALGSSYLLAAVAIVVVGLRTDTSVVGKVFAAAFLSAGGAFFLYAGYVAFNARQSVGETVTASIIIVLGFGSFIVWNSCVSYVSDVMCRTRRSRPLPVADPDHQPFVSLHLPAYNEPPELFIETIRAVEAMDYPNYEIVVIDNNTTDPAMWQPVAEYCAGRDRIKFIHVAPWPGYKAGACNLALRQYTDPRAEIIGIVDADDLVKPYYLKEVAPYFSDPRLGFIQTFEGNRDYEGSHYYTACVDSYQGFYLGAMSSRNERDTIPFVGTMGLFRRSALEEVGGWNEWCICEDTEASVRVHKAGWSGLYIPRCFGRGVVPPTFRGLNTQRHRWCFGGMQILRLHWRSLMPWDRSPDNHLTPAQRRDYLMGGLSWFRDPLMFCFAILLLVTTGLLVSGSGFAMVPLGGDATLLPMSLILVATICLQWTLRVWTDVSRLRAIRGLCISLSAAWITTLACVQGLTYREGRFLRTSKKGSERHPWRMALRLSRVETALAVSLFAAVGALLARGMRPWLLLSVMTVQGIVYVCSPIAAFWNVWAQRVPAHEYRRRYAAQRARLAARRPRPLARPRFGVAGLLAVLFVVVAAIYALPTRVAPVPAATVLEPNATPRVGITRPDPPTTTVGPGNPADDGVATRPGFGVAVGDAPPTASVPTTVVGAAAGR